MDSIKRIGQAGADNNTFTVVKKAKTVTFNDNVTTSIDLQGNEKGAQAGDLQPAQGVAKRCLDLERHRKIVTQIERANNGQSFAFGRDIISDEEIKTCLDAGVFHYKPGAKKSSNKTKAEEREKCAVHTVEKDERSMSWE